ncbi:MAG: GGDEF domain-containing protein [Candidatus Thiodiazotropha sp. (ex Myrtea spinifera)]|nr:GGDEF domain-containing protein [Candidatus Thiodiazotropha sp. (ex Myrtea spinifera)]
MEIPACFQLDAPDDARTWHAKALALLERYEIPPTPVCHLIAYQYASGRYEKLTQTLDAKIAAKEPLDSYLLKNIFDNTCHDEEGAEQIGDRLSDLHGLLFQVLQGVTNACSHTDLFNETLQSQTKALSDNPSLEDLRTIANTLLDATSTAMHNNQVMREQLVSVEEQTKTLQTEVEKLRDEVSTDPLTGLYNRKALSQRMSELLEAADNDLTQPFSLLMLDIDHFKQFNDRFGHMIGDEVIRQVGMTMRELLRQDDFPARYGGEEFTIVLPSTKIDDAVDIARTIHQAISKLVLVRRSTQERLPSITVSVGAATLQHGDNCETLLERADQALYLAKEGGRNRIVTEAEISYM